MNEIVRSEQLHQWCFEFQPPRAFCDLCGRSISIEELNHMSAGELIMLNLEKCEGIYNE